MANPTTNFGWQMPQNTDLVKDLPADFEVFGQAVDTDLADLKGGTTGQVLSKTTNTDLDFTWVTPTDQTPLTTKGDLFTFTTVDARLGVGANGTVLTADSAEASGLRWAAPSSPSFSGCYLYRSTAQTISNNTTTTVLWDSEEFDVGGYHSTSSDTERITIPTGKGGYYLFTFNIFWNTGADSLRQVEMFKNGSTQVGKFDASRASSSYGQGVMGSTILSTAANDYFELKVYQDSGNNVDLRQLNYRSFFACTLLGA